MSCRATHGSYCSLFINGYVATQFRYDSKENYYELIFQLTASSTSNLRFSKIHFLALQLELGQLCYNVILSYTAQPMRTIEHKNRLLHSIKRIYLIINS